MKRVYLDHNATTPMRPEVRAHFQDQLDRIGANPSSVHAAGRAARAALDEARERTAAALGVHEDEIVFTGGGTEADQIAVLGSVRARGPEHGLLTSAVEHAAVLGAGELLAAERRPVVRLPVSVRGEVDPDEVRARMREGWVGTLSIQAANNEIGSVQPLADIASGLADMGKKKPIFHVDAVQALGRVPLDLRALGIDVAAFSGHKLGGPLGVGVLYRRRGTLVRGLTQGGGQESGLRAGTENVPAISATALAIELAVRERASYAARTSALCRSTWEQVVAFLPGVEVNGPPLDHAARLPNTLNLALPRTHGARIDSRVLVARLDLEGLEASAGSACASGSLEPSHVLRALGHDDERARAGLRLSFGRAHDDEDVHIAVDILRKVFFSSR